MKPLILEKAVQRTGSTHQIYKYDNTSDMNVVAVNGQILPFIDIDISNCSLLTETRVNRERDDEESFVSELLTKTAVDRERDDEEISFLELKSKTYVDRERDDEEDTYYYE
jgi:hypothetical protein